MKRRDFLTGTAALLAARTLPVTLPDDRRTIEARPVATPGRPGAADPRFDAIAATVEAKMRDYRIPGVAIGIRKDGATLLRGFGVTNVEDPQPVTTDTIFPLASISKTVAATAIMRLAEQGRIELDASVRQYIPTFRIGDADASAAITIRHLLTHTPGFEGQITGPDRGLASLEAFVETTIRDLPLLAPPGAVWSYNNAGFTIAGRVIEVVAGRDIHNAIRELVFSPLGMSRSFTRIGDVVTHRFAQGHTTSGQLTRPFALSSSVTAGGVAMNIADLLSYAEFHLGEAEGNRASVLSRASLELMRAPQLLKAPTQDAIGLSWHLRPLGGVMTLMHGGTAAAGHRLLLELVPERRLAFAILTNHADGWRLVEDVERAILRTYDDLALAPSQPIVHRGINEVMSHHATPLTAQPMLQQYAGNYRRTPGGVTPVRVEDGTLIVGAGAGTRLLFHGDDVAHAAAGSASGVYEGQPYEFIRGPDGTVLWIRINGRIARRD